MSFPLDDSNTSNFINIGTIQIYFQPKYCSGQPTTPIGFGYISSYQVPNSNGSLTEVIRDTCLSYYDIAGAGLTNQATLDALTTQFGTDYINWKKVTFDYVFGGIAAVKPNGLTDVIEFDYLSEKGGCFTRIYSYPLNWTVQNLGHYDYSGDCPNSIDTGTLNWDNQPYIAVYGPPGNCTGGTLSVTRWGVLFADGRLIQKYITTDTFDLY